MRRMVILLSVLLGCGFAFARSSGIVRSYHHTTANVAPSSTAGDALTVTSAAPPALEVHATTTDPFLIEPSANATLNGAHGIYGSGAVQNEVERAAICETVGGSDHPQGWAVTETAGDGTSAIDCSSAVDGTAAKAYGTDSVKIVLTGTTSDGRVLSPCITAGIGSDVYVSAWAKKTAGTTKAQLAVVQYDAANCTTWLETDWPSGGAMDLSTAWAQCSGQQAAADWNASTSSWRLQLYESCDGGCTMYWDAPSAVVSSVEVAPVFCGTDTDAAAVCNLIDITDHPALTVSSWTIKATIQSPIDGADATPARTIFFSPATAGNNNKVSLVWASDVLTCSVWDSAGTQKTSTVAAAGNADTEYDVKMYHSQAGIVGCCWGATCDATEATGATMDGVGTEQVWGSDGTTGGEVWIKDATIYRRILR